MIFNDQISTDSALLALSVLIGFSVLCFSFFSYLLSCLLLVFCLEVKLISPVNLFFFILRTKNYCCHLIIRFFDGALFYAAYSVIHRKSHKNIIYILFMEHVFWNGLYKNKEKTMNASYKYTDKQELYTDFIANKNMFLECFDNIPIILWKRLWLLT